jgi:hypothetical protein
MTHHPSRQELSLEEAVNAFESLPPQWQLGSLHPKMVQLDSLRDALLRPVYWCFRSGKHMLLHSFHMSGNPGLDINDIQSAYGYGGPISNSDEPEFLKQVDESFREWALENSVIAEFLRFHPLVPHGKWYSGRVVVNRETLHIDLTEDLFSQYEVRRRTDVRRFLEKNLNVEKVSPNIMRDVFPRLYKANMDQVGATSDYYFSEAYFDALFRFDAADNWLVYADNRPIAGAVILNSSNAKVIEYCLAAKEPGSERYKAMAGLLHTAALYYQERTYRYFYLGGGRSTKPEDSLLFFKKGFSTKSFGQFSTASKVYCRDEYAQLKLKFPDRAANGRVLFYKH